MADNSKIEWTDATWNPVTGCSIVSPGCTNCYAMKLAGTRLRNHWSRKGLTDAHKAGPVWNGRIRFNEEWLDQPLRWKRPRMIFVCAHGDLFAEGVTDDMIDKVFGVMALSPQHTFQVLTKRPERMLEYLRHVDENELDPILRSMDNMRPTWDFFLEWPLPNVWLGVSAEDQTRADERIPHLIDTPAGIRFVSAEPLLGPIDFTAWPALDWIIVGGESGRRARPMHPDWPRQIRDDCLQMNIPLFFKQWGSWLPWEPDQSPCWKSQNGRLEDRHALFPQDFDDHPEWDDGLGYLPEHDHAAFQKVGKQEAGRLLDGRIYEQFPHRTGADRHV